MSPQKVGYNNQPIESCVDRIFDMFDGNKTRDSLEIQFKNSR